jgi:hypothetical protein
VNAANHLGILLEKEVQVARRGDAALDGLAAGVRRWRAESLQEIAAQGDAVPTDPTALTEGLHRRARGRARLDDAL